jgi:hypothetical protein
VATYIPLITGSGGALAVLVLWLSLLLGRKLHTDGEFARLEAENTNLREENAQLRAALDSERRSASDVARAGTVTNQLITALTELAAERKQLPSPAIKAKELGL